MKKMVFLISLAVITVSCVLSINWAVSYLVSGYVVTILTAFTIYFCRKVRDYELSDGRRNVVSKKSKILDRFPDT